MIDPLLREDHSVSTSNRTLRQFAVLWFVFLGGLACLEGFGRERWTASYVLGGFAVTVGLVGLVSPQTIRPLFVGLTAITYPIGWVMSHVILSLIYFGVFTPVALAFRIAGRDPLERRFEREAATYWRPKRRTTNMRRYLRQY